MCSAFGGLFLLFHLICCSLYVKGKWSETQFVNHEYIHLFCTTLTLFSVKFTFTGSRLNHLLDVVP